ncbi:MAG: DUF4012 domain-containing protein [Nocardioides sp.]
MASEHRPRRRWGRIVLLVLGLGFLLVVLLVVLVLPFRSVPGDAEAARDDLKVAADALRAGDIAAATGRVESARGHIDRARDTTHGIGGDVWQFVPVAGGGVRDVRHLVEALDDATAIAEIGVEVYPQVLGEDARIVDGTTVDMATLEKVVSAGRDAVARADDASVALKAVDGTSPVIGARLTAARDEAMTALEPVNDLLAGAEPLLDVLPTTFGSEREMKYLVAVLNPAELRYSGGANTALATVRIADGVATFRDIGNLERAPGTSRALYWKKVPGNPFHQRGKTRIQNATWAPDWSTSGEELLRAWAKVTKEEFDGMVAIDVPAIASLVEVTGPIDVPDVGTVDHTNLTQTLIGSYDRFNDIAKRRALNRSLIPIFRDRLFAGGQFVEKFQSLGRSAAARHFAVYLRDEKAQALVEDLGADGDLSDTEHDYLGVFSQNTNIAKSDYWLQRSLSSDVLLRKDGSAQVELTVTVANSAPPYAQAGEDPRTGYFTRWSESAVAVFLPRGVKEATVRRDGQTLTPFVDTSAGRPFLYQNFVFAPRTTRTMTVTYDVPRAAEVRGDGGLVYRLDADPQGMVTPESLAVSVRFPRGYVVRDRPTGWVRTGPSSANWEQEVLAESPRWTLAALPRQ